MHRYKVTIRWQHPKLGPGREQLTITATNIRTAVHRALGILFEAGGNEPLRRDRRPAHRNVTIEAERLGPAPRHGAL